MTITTTQRAGCRRGRNPDERAQADRDDGAGGGCDGRRRLWRRRGGARRGGGGSGGTVKGGILRVGTTNYIDSLNPFVAIESQSYNAFVMEYPQLVQYGPGEKLEGDWATSWSHSSDGLTWTFHLKAGGKWSDGKPLTAADAAWTGNTIVKYADGADGRGRPPRSRT